MNPKTIRLRLASLIFDLVLDACPLHLGKKPLVFGLSIDSKKIPMWLWESHDVLEWPNDPSSATRPTERMDCNGSAMAGFAAAHD